MPQLLQTKLYLPPLPASIVERPHLLTQLDQGLNCKLTLICAPAGFGKSTLAAAWLRDLAAPPVVSSPPLAPAWFAIDETDNDLTTFLSYLVGAVQTAVPHAGEAFRRVLEQPILPPPERLAAELARECAAFPHQVVLALDNYHLIHEPSVHRFMLSLLRHLPPELHLVVIARFDPPLGLSQLRARGEVAELRLDDLQFNLAETTQLLDEMVSAPLTTEQLVALQERTEGWVVGLRLVAISLQSATDAASFVQRFVEHSSRYVVDYLVDEALGQQEEGVQGFLLKTSVLGRMTAGLCGAVVGQDEGASQRRLEELERRNLFVVALDDHREWYRYHHQFQTMLQTRLRARVTGEEIAELHQRAAMWLERQGLVDEALEHYAAIPDHLEAARLIERNLARMQNTESWHTLSQWLRLIPMEVTRQRPALLLAHAWVCDFHYDRQTIPSLVHQVERLLTEGDAATDDVTLAEYQGEVHALRVLRIFRDLSPDQRLVEAQRALELLPSERQWVRSFALFQRIVILREQGQFAVARQIIQAELDAAGTEVNSYVVRLYYMLAMLEWMAGSLADVYKVATRLHEVASQANMLGSTGWAYLSLGSVYYLTGAVDQALVYLDPLFDRPSTTPLQAQLSGAYFLLTILATRGELERGQRILAQLHTPANGGEAKVGLFEINALNAYLHLLQGRSQEALDWARASWPNDLPRVYLFGTIILGRILLAAGEPLDWVRATEALEEVAALNDAKHATPWSLASRVVLAQVLWARDLPRRALSALEEAVERGYPRGYRRWFVEGGPVVAHMLERLAQQGRSSEEARDLLTLFPASDRRPTTSAPPQPAAALVEPLTEREREVLTLLAAGLSNKEIAHRLRISPLTVRNHTSNIYGKLGVDDRAQAVRYARAIGLLRD